MQRGLLLPLGQAPLGYLFNRQIIGSPIGIVVTNIYCRFVKVYLLLDARVKIGYYYTYFLAFV